MRKIMPQTSLDILDTTLAKNFPRTLAERYQIIPLFQKDNELHVGIRRPHDVIARDVLKTHFERTLSLRSVPLTESQFASCLSKLYEGGRTIKNLFQDQNVTPTSGNYTAEIVHRLLLEAVNLKASDIHLIPEPPFLRIYYRIDGIHRPHFSLQLKFWEGLCIRLKWLADLNIAQELTPQSGKAFIDLEGRSMQCRISTHPTQEGDSMTIRLLNLSKTVPDLETLGFDPETLSLLSTIPQNPEGLVIVTGPTGSGKTTTLYGLLNEHLKRHQSVATLEQPIECFLPGSRQTEIQENGPLTFGQGVRSLLRHDPDVMLVGEVRDEETAHTAVRAALTGHRVYTTLHAGCSFQAPFRFVDLGATMKDLLPNLTHIINQRLIPVLCPLCKKTKGCPRCNGYGFSGRTPIAEVIVMDDNFRALYLEENPLKMLRAHQRKKNLPSLWDQGLQLLRSKKTTKEQLKAILGDPAADGFL
jgi:type II secretory ATPase GspE/PulE/Tfp pilus assembly ATPase PilB-like protein